MNPILGSTLVIHHIPGNHKMVASVVRGLRRQGDGEVSVLAFRDKAALEKRGVPCRTQADYLTKEELDQIKIDGIDFLESLARKQVDGHTSLAGLLEYNGSSLWWFTEAAFYSAVRETTYWLGILSKIVEQEDPRRIAIVDDKSDLVKILALVARSHSIPILFFPPGPTLWLRSLIIQVAPRQHLLDVLARLKDGITARILGSSPPPRNATASGQRTVLLSSAGRQHVSVDPNTGKKKREDVVLGPVIQQLEQDKANRLLFLDSTLGLYQAIRATKVDNLSPAIRRPESYLNPDIRRAVKRQKKILVEKWQRLVANGSLERLLTYKGIDLTPLLKDHLEYVFCQRLVEVTKNIELAKHILDVEKPDMLVLASETTMFNKSLLLGCKGLNIPSLAIHHGNVIPLKTVFNQWRFSEADLSGNPSRLALVPDRVCVYGQEARDILASFGFPPDRIVVTGQPRFDILARASELYDRHGFCQRWGIDPSAKIALIGSQPFDHIEGDREGYRYVFIESIMKALKAEKGIQVVIKPHPYEGDQWHRRVLTRLGEQAVVLPAKSNPYEALYACDVLITFYSTIFMEALILGKPVVTVNLTGRPSPVPIAEAGVALGAYKAQDIAPTIHAALWNSETRKTLKANSDKYLEKSVYKTDGRSTERVVQLIYDIIDKNSHRANIEMRIK